MFGLCPYAIHLAVTLSNRYQIMLSPRDVHVASARLHASLFSALIA